mgnify:CR=1 FL=1
MCQFLYITLDSKISGTILKVPATTQMRKYENVRVCKYEDIIALF